MSITLSPKTYLDWPDYLVIIFVLALCTFLGFFFRQRKKKQQDANGGGLMEFVLASRNLSVFPVAVSITATSLSAFSLTSVTGELYLYGIQYCIEYIGIFIGSVFAAYMIVPIYRECQYVSVFEIMEKRLNRTMRKVFSLAYILQKVVQAILMFVTLLMVAIQGVVKIGGTDELLKQSVKHNFVTAINFTEDYTTRYSVWSALAFGFLWALDLFMVNQALVQRIFGAHSDQAAKRSVIFGGFLSLIFGATIALTGAVLYVYYKSCDPMKFPDYTGVIRIDQLFVYAIGDLFHEYPILKGIAISGIISASLSTYSSFVNSFAAVTLEDFIKPAFPKINRNENASLLICMGLSMVFGIIPIFGSFLIPLIGNAVKALGIVNGVFGGPLVGASFLVLFWKKTNVKSCVGSLLIGIIFNAWIIVGSFVHAPKRSFKTLELSTDQCDWDDVEIFIERITNISNNTNQLFQNSSNCANEESVFMPLYKISFMWYPAIGFIITLLVGSLLTKFTVKNDPPTTSSRVYFHVKGNQINENVYEETRETIALTPA